MHPRMYYVCMYNTNIIHNNKIPNDNNRKNVIKWAYKHDISMTMYI